MREISLQMIDHSVSSKWWKELIRYFLNIGDSFEIRCWKEEINEIQLASLYGKQIEENYEVSIKGVVNEKLLSELLSEDPKDKCLYNKMTKYFTINVDKGQRRFCSAHYGTEIYIIDLSNEDAVFFQEVMKNYSKEEFSINIK